MLHFSNSHSLEFLLAALKVIGIVGAFAGFSLEKPPEGKRGTGVAILFLGVAIAAEIFDSVIKYQDGEEQTARFERLAHPIGSIEVVPIYHISLDSQYLDGYRKRVQKSDLVEPDPIKEGPAYALLAAAPFIRVFIYKDGAHHDANTEPSLSFEVRPPAALRNNLNEQRYPNLSKVVFEPRHYTYVPPEEPEKPEEGNRITAQFSYRNEPADRYSDGEIVSDKDLLGALIEMSFCPEVFLHSPKAENPGIEKELGSLVILDQTYIAFPGRQEISIWPGDTKHVSVARSDNCTSMFFEVPNDPKEYRKLLVP